MKKLLAAVLVCLSLVGLFSAAAFAAQPTIIRVAHVLAETHASHLALVEFKKYVEEKSQGKLKIELYPNAQLGSDRQALEGVGLGTLEMTMCTGSILSALDEKFSILDLPFLFKTREAAHKALDGELGKDVAKLLEPHNLVCLGIAEGGYRNITNSKRPIYKPEDLKGLKIRTMENHIHIAAFRSWGANPTPMAFGELYTALQQGTVDAQENPISIIYTSKFYEVQKFGSLTGHVYGTVPIFINKAFFDKLPKDLQKVLVDGGKLCRDLQRKLAGEQDVKFVNDLKTKGMAINELTPAQKQVFIDRAKVVYDDFRKKFGEDLLKKATKYN
jgi:C4-dicarboxylate-binding protein DctP